MPEIEVVQLFDYKTACGKRAKKVPIAKIRALRFQRLSKPLFQTTVDGAWQSMDLLKRGQNRHAPLSWCPVEPSFRPLKAAKINDLRDLLQYVDEEVRCSPFYESLASVDDASDEAVDEYEA